MVAIVTGFAPALNAGADLPLLLTFVNENVSYPAENAWFMFSYTGSSATDFVGTVEGTGPKSGPIVFTEGAGKSVGSYFSEVFQITDLAAGVSITKAPSTRIYVSLGQALDNKPAAATPTAPFSDFGSPSPTDPSDPNWNIRWDYFETTLSSPRSAGDYGDISAINQLAVPLRIELYDSATEYTQENLLQSAQTADYPGILASQLRALAAPNLANNNSTLAGPWYFATARGAATPENPYPNSFLRMVGPASGGTNPEWIGPFPSMNPYAEFVANIGGTPISTTLSETTSIAATVQQTYTMATTATIAGQAPTGIEVSGTIETSTWDAGTTTWNTPTTDGKTYAMTIALDTNVGQASGANYSFSNAIYGSAWNGNSGVAFSIADAGGEPAAVTEQDFIQTLSTCDTNCTPCNPTAVTPNTCTNNYMAMGLQTVNQWMQNLFVGYNFGLIGNTSTISALPSGDPYENQTLNEMGSAGWAHLEDLINVGTLGTSDVPFFTLTDSQHRPLYNQWGKIVFDNSQTVYGMQYSDMFQPLLALYTYESNFVNNVYQPTTKDVLAWRITILAPEPGAIATAATALGALAAASRLRRRRA